ncbi:Similar to BCL2L1: Bcl-2-like protein 1 (Homo sapiens) [Cotesia congregata]|uniref:Similar to BCL2L1: Bcl-2-like protein 1 (Homo sapiens) n=1 Tax=Cotesia congregata TaxID=51543 RepID=A0A8J2HG19_COTCN|nr:Similar to BCL2L1: Bcl-2-like protein 1 (Homo sapiens) [Cotesia congregata]
MAGDSTTNNEIGEGVEQGASVRGERHSRVGGILECDPPGNRNSLSMSDQANENTDDDEDGVCRYGIRLQNFFPHLAPPSSRYGICDDNVELTAEILAHDVIRYLLKEDMYLISRDSISRSMRHNVYQMLNKHSILFTSMVNRLNVVPDTAYEAFTGVADELFLHGEITWAKIVCLYAFMGRLALWARDGRMHALKQKLPLYVSRYIGEAIAHFIKVAEEVSGAVWRSLLMTGATLSLVATILTVTA